MWKTILIVLAVLFGLQVLNSILIMIIGERGLVLRESTKAFMKEAGWKRVLNPMAFMHGYIYFRWLRQYVGLGVNYVRKIPVIGPLLVDKLIRPNYHAKTLTLDQAEALITIDREIPLQDLGEQIIPYPVARDFVIGESTDFAVMECACRTSRKEHCEPTQVCIIVGQPFVDFVIEHTPQLARRISRKEALDIVRDQHERGNVQSAWFKDATINRIWALCNCCKCCCAGIQFLNDYKIKIMASSGFIPEIDEKKCNACGKCAKLCCFNALSAAGDSAVLDWDKCKGCGVCVDVCPKHAITLVRDKKKGEPLDVRVLAAK